jgi:glycosyltransferase involved in cell wall biosynthesis
VASALHAAGAVDRVQTLNRLLAPLTDAFIAVAEPHGRYLAEHEGCTASKIRAIPNGVDTERFRPRPPQAALRESLGLAPDVPVAGIVAALRPEKNHPLFLRAAARVRRELPNAQFLVIGDGPRRASLESLAGELGIADAVRFLGTRSDVPDLLSLIDVAVLTSHMEANPVSILEAMAAEKPVVATRVGAVAETVLEGSTGFLTAPGADAEIAQRIVELLRDRPRAVVMGRAGRQHVLAQWSIDRMVEGYQDLLAGIYAAKSESRSKKKPLPTADSRTPEGAGLGLEHPAG